MIKFEKDIPSKVDNSSGDEGKIFSLDINMIFDALWIIYDRENIPLKTDILDLHRDKLFLKLKKEVDDLESQDNKKYAIISNNLNNTVAYFELNTSDDCDGVKIGDNYYLARDKNGYIKLIAGNEYIGFCIDNDFYVMNFKEFADRNVSIDKLVTLTSLEDDNGNIILDATFDTYHNPSFSFSSNGVYIVTFYASSTDSNVGAAKYIALLDTISNKFKVISVSDHKMNGEVIDSYYIDNNKIIFNFTGNIAIDKIYRLAGDGALSINAYSDNDLNGLEHYFIKPREIPLEDTPSNFNPNNIVNIYSGPNEITDIKVKDDATNLGLVPQNTDNNQYYITYHFVIDGKNYYLFIGYNNPNYVYTIYDGTQKTVGNKEITQNDENDIKNNVCGNTDKVYQDILNMHNDFISSYTTLNGNKSNYHSKYGSNTEPVVIKNNNPSDNAAITYKYLDDNFKTKTGNIVSLNYIDGGNGNLETLRRVEEGTYTNCQIENVTYELGEILGTIQESNYMGEYIVSRDNNEFYLTFMGTNNELRRVNLSKMVADDIWFVYITMDGNAIYIVCNSSIYRWKIKSGDLHPTLIDVYSYINGIYLNNNSDNSVMEYIHANANGRDFLLYNKRKDLDAYSFSNRESDEYKKYLYEYRYAPGSDNPNRPVYTRSAFYKDYNGEHLTGNSEYDIDFALTKTTVVNNRSEYYVQTVEIDDDGNYYACSYYYGRGSSDDFEVVDSTRLHIYSYDLYIYEDNKLFLSISMEDPNGGDTLLPGYAIIKYPNEKTDSNGNREKIEIEIHAFGYDSDSYQEIDNNKIYKHGFSHNIIGGKIDSYLNNYEVKKYLNLKKYTRKDTVFYSYNKGQMLFDKSLKLITRLVTNDAVGSRDVFKDVSGYYRYDRNGYIIKNSPLESFLPSEDMPGKFNRYVIPFEKTYTQILDRDKLLRIENRKVIYNDDNGYPVTIDSLNGAIMFAGHLDDGWIIIITNDDNKPIEIGHTTNIYDGKDNNYTDVTSDIENEVGSLKDCRFKLTDDAKSFIVKNIKTGVTKIIGPRDVMGTENTLYGYIYDLTKCLYYQHRENDFHKQRLIDGYYKGNEGILAKWVKSNIKIKDNALFHCTIKPKASGYDIGEMYNGIVFIGDKKVTKDGFVL